MDNQANHFSTNRLGLQLSTLADFFGERQKNRKKSEQAKLDGKTKNLFQKQNFE